MKRSLDTQCLRRLISISVILLVAIALCVGLGFGAEIDGYSASELSKYIGGTYTPETQTTGWGAYSSRAECTWNDSSFTLKAVADKGIRDSTQCTGKCTLTLTWEQNGVLKYTVAVSNSTGTAKVDSSPAYNGTYSRKNVKGGTLQFCVENGHKEDTTQLKISALAFTPYYITTFEAPDGSGSYTVNGEAYSTLNGDNPAGTTYTLAATPAEGWSFKGWEVQQSGGTWATAEWSGSNAFTPTADTTVRPVFQQNSVTLTFKQAAGGTFSVDGDEITTDRPVSCSNGQKINLSATVTSKEAYLIGFSVAGEEMYLDAAVRPSGTGTMEITATKTGDVFPIFTKPMTVTFQPAEGLTYHVKAALLGEVMWEESITKATTVTVPSGSDFTLEANDSDTRKFIVWKIGGVEKSSAANWSTKLAEGNVVSAETIAYSANGFYLVNGTGYQTWDEAMKAANGNATVTLVQDVELPKTLAGNGLSSDGEYVRMNNGVIEYIIPANVHLVIPYSSSGTTTARGSTNALPYAITNETTETTNALKTSESFEYRKLTIPSGARIVIENNALLGTGGTICSKFDGPGGATVGSEGYTYSVIDAQGEIVVNSGGVLTSCGYIYGSGRVTAESGAKIYQPFAICDYNGGGYTVGTTDSGTIQSGEKAVAPFIRYTMQNIQTPLTVKSGAKMYGYCDLYTDSISIISAKHNETTPLIIGGADDTALLKLDNGAVLEASYTANNCVTGSNKWPPVGKTHLTLTGGASLGTLELKVTMVITKTVSTADVTFPLPYNYEIDLKKGNYSIGYALAMLPGSTVRVASDATLTSTASRFVVYDMLHDHTTTGATAIYNKGSTAGSRRYPDDTNLAAAGYSKTANLIVNGTLNLNSGSFGGVAQTENGGTVKVSNAAVGDVTAQIGLAGKYNFMGVKDYSYAGGTVRTLKGQILNRRTGKLVNMTANQTYRGTTYTGGTLTEYSFKLYTDSNGANTIYTQANKEFSAPITGAWYQKSITYHDGETTLGTDYYMNSDIVTLRALPDAPDGYHYDGKWYTNADCTIEAGTAGETYDNLAADTDISLYAKRVSNTYTVTVTSATTNSTTPVADVSLDGLGTYQLYKDSVTIIAPEKQGFTFKGWYKEAQGYDGNPLSTDLVVAKSLTELLNAGMADDKNVISLVAVYESKAETNLTLTLNKAPSGVTVSGDNVTGNNGTWSVPVGTEVTIDASNVSGFQYWTNANDKVMSRELKYTFTMVTNTTLTAETNNGTNGSTFVIFQSADGRLLKYTATTNLSESDIPTAPYRVGYKFAGWKVGDAAPVSAEEVPAALSDKKGVVTVTAAYEEITEAAYIVTASANVSGVTITNANAGKNTYTLGDIAKFTAPDKSSDGKTFRFWAADKDGTNILSFSTTYSFRVTQKTDIYAIYGGETVTDRPPVVRVDNVLKNSNGQTQSLTFMIGASIPSDYELVEMGALYAKDLNTDVNADKQLRVEKVDNNTVRKAVSKLTQQENLTDYSYALGFNMTGKLTDTISLRGYVAVKKTDDSADSTIYYYYSGVRFASYNNPSGTNSQGG